MKKILLAICLTIFLISCEEEDKPKDYVVLSGNVENLDGNITFYLGSEHTIAINPDGSFIDTLSVKPGNYRFKDVLRNGAQIYLENGKDLHITYNAKDYDTFLNSLSFSGVGKVANDYTLRKKEIYKEHEEGIITDSIQSFYSLDELSYIKSQDKLKKELLEELMVTKGVSETYIKLEKRNIEHQYLLGRITYKQFRSFNTASNAAAISDNFLDGLKHFDDSSSEDFRFSEAYISIIQMQANMIAMEQSKAENSNYYIKSLNYLSEIKNDTIKNELMYFEAGGAFEFSKKSELREIYDTFMKYSTNEEHKTLLTQRYKNIIKLAKGSPSAKFIDYENFEGGTSSLDDFKGKYVFIDVWATWCGPCVFQMPYIDKLEKAYHGKNLAFVSISLDTQRNHDKWYNFVKKENLDGVQLLADKDFKSEFIKEFGIKGIPKFILIDPDGNIVDANAPRPSEPQLKEILDSLPL